MAGLRWIALLIVYAGLLLAPSGSAVAQTPQEYKQKRAFLYNFVKYVRWPPETGDQLVIGVLGKDPFAAVGAGLPSGTLAGKKIVVRRFDSMAEYSPCQILFISGTAADGGEEETAEDRLKAAVERTRGSPVLLVSESRGLAKKGAMINFRVDVQANSVRMDINLDATKRAGLSIAAPLLGLSSVTIVQNGETGSD